MANDWYAGKAAKTFGKKSAQTTLTNNSTDFFGPPSKPVSRTSSAYSADDYDENPFASTHKAVKPAIETRDRVRTMSENSMTLISESTFPGKSKRKAKEDVQDQKKTRARATSPVAAYTGGGNPTPCQINLDQKQSSTFTFSAGEVSTLGGTYPGRYAF